MTSIFSSMLALLPSMVPFASYEAMPTPIIPSTCRCFPGDKCYQRLGQFQSKIGGKLIAPVPIAAVCHNDQFATYNAIVCATLKENWFLPETHLSSSSCCSAMAWMFADNACNPFLSNTTLCALGNYVSYTVNATTADDVKEAVKFANLFNVRPVIRATGYDYNGKSTGAGALAVWTYHLTSISLTDSYESAAYTGKAAVVGSGVSSQQAYEFADANNGIIITVNYPTVAPAG
ncbi:uncharacterized protein EAF02_003605 [Botrytis sinoallii]|uniref:uncharacterized protein n=1 Tax=Botrytis sinoallii TaxID=1463999 RepID=UPI0019028612|nr:uncharacterized protein EAF02_003605 [Botrytis sinoallii]KAF7886958.1 hypothetical protein EAF02_003605 [Botrytis sinoallii]